MSNQFEFFEYVTFTSDDPEFAEINGKTGVIMTMGQSDDGTWGYGVRFAGEEERWDVSERDLKPTGKKGKREDFYPGDTLRVRPDGSVIHDD
ncbi:MAG: Imm31 family immunity protein [Geminicoccaceae bacterium]